MGCSTLFIHLICLVIISTKIDTKGVYYFEEKNGQTHAQPVESVQPSTLSEQIKDIFQIELDELPDEHAEDEYKQLTKNKYIADYMKNLYKDLENLENSQSNEAKNLQEWISADEIISSPSQRISERQDDGTYIIEFSRSNIPDLLSSTIIRAQLRVNFYGLTSPSVVTLIDTRNLNEHQVISPENKLFVTDVTSIVNEWANNKNIKCNIKLHLTTNDNVEIDSFIVIAVKEDLVHQPKSRRRRAITTKTSTPKDIQQQKSKRSESAYFEKLERNEVCHKKGLYVDFDALGWKQWVIAPEGFSAFYCAGACSTPFHQGMNVTAHAIVQSLVHLVRPNATTEPKCAPAQLSSMKIVFIDHKKNVLIKRYRDMVVKECGCF